MYVLVDCIHALARQSDSRGGTLISELEYLYDYLSRQRVECLAS